MKIIDWLFSFRLKEGGRSHAWIVILIGIVMALWIAYQIHQAYFA